MNREKVIEKIKALLNKTVDNGCSEEEMGAALDKARAWMDAHEITEDELRLTKEERRCSAASRRIRSTRTTSSGT